MCFETKKKRAKSATPGATSRDGRPRRLAFGVKTLELASGGCLGEPPSFFGGGGGDDKNECFGGAKMAVFHPKKGQGLETGGEKAVFPPVFPSCGGFGGWGRG